MEVFQDIERRKEQVFLYKIQHQTGFLDMKGSLCEHCVAGDQWFRNLFCQADGPVVMFVPPIQKRDDEASIRYAFHRLENPLRFERSEGRSTAPANRMNDLPLDVRAISS